MAFCRIFLKLVGRDERSRIIDGSVSQVQFQQELKSGFSLSGKTFIPQEGNMEPDRYGK